MKKKKKKKTEVFYKGFIKNNKSENFFEIEKKGV